MSYISKFMDKLNVTSFNKQQLDIINNHQKKVHLSFKDLMIFGLVFYVINGLESTSSLLNFFLLVVDICISLCILHLSLFMFFGDMILMRKLKNTIKKGLEED